MSQYGSAEKFIEIYNKLDNYMQDILVNNPEIQGDLYTTNHINYSRKVELLVSAKFISDNNKAELISYGSLRNAIVHRYKKGNKNEEKIIAHPIASEVEYFDRLASKIMMPPKAYENIVVKKDSMYYATADSKVNNIIRDMDKNKYSYIPIIEEDKLTGVFSQDTLFTYIAKNEGFIFDEQLQLSEFGEMLYIDNHSSERFEFVPRNITIAEIEQIFSGVQENEKRIEVIFMTENGLPSEKILGLTTVWDLMKFKASV